MQTSECDVPNRNYSLTRDAKNNKIARIPRRSLPVLVVKLYTDFTTLSQSSATVKDLKFMYRRSKNDSGNAIYDEASSS